MPFRRVLPIALLIAGLLGCRPASQPVIDLMGGTTFDYVDSFAGESLATLSLTDTELDDHQFARIGPHIRNFDSLNLSRTAVTDAAAEVIGSARRLQILTLRSTRITDAGVRQLQHLRSLRILNLANLRLTDQSLVTVARFHRLQALDLSETNITDNGLPHLRLLPLRRLNLAGTAITDAGLATLGDIQTLDSLHLDDTRISDAGLQHIARLSHLKWLDCQGTDVTPAGLRQLHKSLPKLELGE